MNPIALAIQQSQRITYALILAVVVLLCLYVYFLSTSIVYVVARKDTLRDINELHSEISRLEASYIAAQHAVSADIAAFTGFTLTDTKIFISRTPDTLVLRDE